MADMQDFFTTAEAAKLLGISRQRANQVALSGALKAKKIAGRYFVHVDDLERYIYERRPMGRPRKQR
jgi:excisionase family DNA binding protein